MSRNRLLPLAALAFVAACNDEPDVIAPPAGAGALLERYVAIGNSVTAGVQGSGISNTTQQQAYPRLIAQQAGTRYNYARLAGNGCPPPIIDFFTGIGEGNVPAAQRTAVCSFRDPATTTGPLNNVAVPAATTLDPTSTSTPTSNALTQFILGGKTQVQRTLDADPTFVSVWIGTNDVLIPALSGVLVPLAGVSPGMTPTATFTTRYAAIIDQLLAGAPNLRGGLLVGTPYTSALPVLFSGDILYSNAGFQAAFRQVTGGSATNPADLIVDANCNGAGALVSMQIVPRIRAYRANPADPTAHPAIISCAPSAAYPAPVGEIFILTAAEQAAVTARVNEYNQYIASRAAAAGFAYVDPNPSFLALRQSGQIPPVPDFTTATATFGPLFSLDGFHPSAAGHKIIANLFIAAINAEYGTTIPAVP